ncbi:MAG: glycosyltransferase family 4 protein [Armatimonadetes bacterium]|nr:glycosyltransferase family 4 protein [Armatimonadota bacterium]
MACKGLNRTRANAAPSCSFLSYAKFPSEYAHTVQIMSVCGALESLGIRTCLHAVRAEDYSGDSKNLCERYGIADHFEVRWYRPVSGRTIARARLLIRGFLAARSADFVYTRNVTIAAGAALARGRCVLEFHSPVFPKVERRLVRSIVRSRRVCSVTISRRLAELMALQYGLEAGDFLVEHDACDPDEASRAEPAVLRCGHELVAMYVGSFYPGRGVETIVELARRLPNVVFVAVGGEASDAGREGSSPLPNLVFHPRVDRSLVPSLLAGADVLLMPYGSVVTVAGEGNNRDFCSPLKLFEYLATGKPIVSSWTCSISEVLHDGENALLVKSSTVDEWEACVSRLVADEALRRLLGDRARRTALEHTWRGRTQRIVEAVQAR